MVASEFDVPVGRLTVMVKSAHLYEPEWELMRTICQEALEPAG